jgi:hypothetical protein
MASFNFTSAVLDEGTTFNFGSWVYIANIANSSGDFNNHLAVTRKPKASTSASSCNIDDLAYVLGGIQLSDLIGSYANHIRATPRPLITSDDLITGIDRLDDNIAKCIKLAEDALQQHDDSPTQNHPKAHHHHPVTTGNIFSSIHRVIKGITDCISLAESTLHFITPREPKDFDYDFNNFIGKLETPRPCPIRSEVVLPKTLSALEEDLDHLL